MGEHTFLRSMYLGDFQDYIPELHLFSNKIGFVLERAIILVFDTNWPKKEQHRFILTGRLVGNDFCSKKLLNRLYFRSKLMEILL